MVDLKGLTAITEDGQKVLLELMNEGARFRSPGAFTKQVLKRSPPKFAEMFLVEVAHLVAVLLHESAYGDCGISFVTDGEPHYLTVQTNAPHTGELLSLYEKARKE